MDIKEALKGGFIGLVIGVMGMFIIFCARATENKLKKNY